MRGGSASVGTGTILAGLLQISLGATGECYLVNSNGTFLAHKELARVLSGPYIKVIDVPAAAGGRYAQVVADPQSGKALCFLYSPHGSRRVESDKQPRA